MNQPDRLTRREFVRSVAAAGAAGYLLGCQAPRTRPDQTARGIAEPAPAEIDPGDWEGLAELALRRIRAAGAEYGDIRILRTRSQSVRGQDGRIAGVSDGFDHGLGVRVLYHGAWGFAATSLVTAAETQRVADQAIAVAKASASRVVEPVRLAPEPPHRDRFVTQRRVDPFSIPIDAKSASLLEIMELLHQHDGIARSSASLWTQRDEKLFASTEGSLIHFDLLACHGGFSATALHEGRFASRSFATPYLRTGYELIEETDLLLHVPRVAAQAVEKVRAPAVPPGAYDLVLDAEHLALTIHETCGHPSELDRALGYEANYAGTSFLTPDQLGRLQYGSKHVNLVADNTEPGCLASTGYDDEGVACQRWDIVREGVFVGYSTSREVATRIGLPRSTGSCRADSWESIPIVRIANVGLQPGDASFDDLFAGIRRGIYIEGRGSFSIDQKRYNFQFGGDAFWLIENGRRTHMLRDVIYTGITPEFWNACDAVGDRSLRERDGFINCGKGQPGQSGWMTHAACPARFRAQNVITGRTA